MEDDKRHLKQGVPLWKLVTPPKVGQPRKFPTAAILWEKASNYFAWCERNPWTRPELVKYQGEAEEYAVPIGRPFTVDGLCAFVGVSGGYFRACKANLRDKIERGKGTPEDEATVEVIETIENIIRNQQIEGATVGVFNPGIVARLNGLADTVNNVNSGDAILRISVRDSDTAENVNKLQDLL